MNCINFNYCLSFAFFTPFNNAYFVEMRVIYDEFCRVVSVELFSPKFEC